MSIKMSLFLHFASSGICQEWHQINISITVNQTYQTTPMPPIQQDHLFPTQSHSPEEPTPDAMSTTPETTSTVKLAALTSQTTPFTCLQHQTTRRRTLPFPKKSKSNTSQAPCSPEDSTAPPRLTSWTK